MAGNESVCTIQVEIVEVEERAFVRGDANEDSRVDISDVIFTLYFLYIQHLLNKTPNCDDAVDSNDDGNLDMSDILKTLHYIFLGMEPPAPPSPGENAICDFDPTPDDLSCGMFKPCQ